MGNVLSGAGKACADALQAFIGSSKGADPGAKEIDETLRKKLEELKEIQSWQRL